MRHLSLGFSPCPNDTFIFHALVHGAIDAEGLAFESRLEDVETLNRLALEGALDVTKVSFGVLPFLLDDYVLLRSGGALGRNCGPLVVARTAMPADRLGVATIAIPGRLTTANLLLRMFLGGPANAVEMTYDRIMPAVAAGEVDAGLIIHESRFTFPDHGLVRVMDLGEWWESTTGAPIPLGAIVAKRSLGGTSETVERLIRESLLYAFRNPEASRAYVRANAQEMSDDVTRSHIDLYVNDFSIDVGAEGELAIVELMQRAGASGLIAEAKTEPFSGAGAIIQRS